MDMDINQAQKQYLSLVQNDKVMNRLFSFLSPTDALTVRSICQNRKALSDHHLSCRGGAGDVYSTTEFSELMERIEILDKILSFLPKRDDRCNYRLVCVSFNIAARYRTVFVPVLSDTTFSSILNMGYETDVSTIKAEDLYLPLPVDENGLLLSELCSDRVRSLCFYEGVSPSNKIVLILSFPNLQELKYIRCSTFDFPQQVGMFRCLISLHIEGIAQKDNGNLEEFFAQAIFPKLTHLYIELHFRRDLMLYMELHNFIANHHSTLQSLQLELRSFSYPSDIRESAGSMLILLSNDLIDHFDKIVRKLKLVSLESLIITFLDYEGTAMFHLGFKLLLAQTRLKTLKIVKEFSRTRRESLPLYNSIQNNERTLEVLSIPHPYDFNCSALSPCSLLKSLTVGRLWNFRFADANVEFLECLPTHKAFKAFRMSINLTLNQIHWIVQHLDLTELEFRGIHGELYTLNTIHTILRCQPSLIRLEFECHMTVCEYKLMKMFFKFTPGISMVWSHLDSCEADFGMDGRRGEFQISIDRSVFRMQIITSEV